MFKTVNTRVWAFDAEWIPDPLAGRMLYGLPEDMPDQEVFEMMWQKGGATDEDPMPYLKTVVCRIVSIVAVERIVREGRARLHLLSLPAGMVAAAALGLKHSIGDARPAQKRVRGFNHLPEIRVIRPDTAEPEKVLGIPFFIHRDPQ